MSDKQRVTDELIRVLISAPDSSVAKFLNIPAPVNDFDYVQMWVEYYRHILMDNDCFKKLLKDGWHNNENAGLSFEMRYSVWKEIKTNMKEALRVKKDAVSFKPRLEIYIETFPKEEQEHVRKLIIACFINILENNNNKNLIDIINSFEIDKNFIFSIGEEHKLVHDRVIGFDSSSFSFEEPITNREVVSKATAYKIISGIKVSEKELLTFGNSPLVNMFNLNGNGLEVPLLYPIADNEKQIDNERFDFSFEKIDIDKLIKHVSPPEIY